MNVTATTTHQPSLGWGAATVALKTSAMGLGAAVTGWVPVLPALAIGATAGTLANALSVGLKPPEQQNFGQGLVSAFLVGLSAPMLSSAGIINAVGFKTALWVCLAGYGVIAGALIGVMGVAAVCALATQPTAYA